MGQYPNVPPSHIPRKTNIYEDLNNIGGLSQGKNVFLSAHMNNNDPPH
jgi:hypothetical protein